MTDALWAWSARELAQAIRKGDVTSREATESAFARMDLVNPAINAVVISDREAAFKQADEADAAVRAGATLGVLHGVPITIKMNVDVQGMARDHGLKAFEGRVAADNSPVVSNLRKAGAVTLGLTNCPAFAARGCTSNELYGVTKNPWSEAITPGGSSGGAAAAVAAGIGALAHGNDLGGSIRTPAYLCGVFGLRVTPSRIPNFNPSVIKDRPTIHQSTTSQGPLARTMSGIRLGYEAMSARDSRDPWWVPPMDPQHRVYGPTRVALCEAPASAEPVVNQTLARLAGWLEDAGYQVERVAAPRFDEVGELHTSLLHAERSLSTIKDIEKYGDEYIKRAMAARVVAQQPKRLADMVEYLDAVTLRSSIMREWMQFFDEYPLMILPDLFVHTLPQEYDQLGDARIMEQAQWALTPHRVVSCLSMPVMTVPCGLVNGLPIGAQIVASRYQEDFLMDVGDIVQTRNGMGEPVTPSWL